jgi:hypothetical protein
MKPANPITLIVQFDNGTKYIRKIKIDSLDWKKVVPFVFNEASEGRWLFPLKKRIKEVILSLFSL